MKSRVPWSHHMFMTSYLRSDLAASLALLLPSYHGGTHRQQFFCISSAVSVHWVPVKSFVFIPPGLSSYSPFFLADQEAGPSESVPSSPTANTKRKERRNSVPVTSKGKRQRKRVVGPNFRHYPGEGNPDPSFVSQKQDSPAVRKKPPKPKATLTTSVSAPDEFPDPKHPAPLPAVAKDAFAASSSSLLPQGSLPWNPSELGIVHLPLDSISSGSSHAGSAHSSRAGRSVLGSIGKSSTQEGSPAPFNRQSKVLETGSSSNSSSGASSDAVEGRITVRFKHVEDENGHHVITGREGTLSKCEDEVKFMISFCHTPDSHLLSLSRHRGVFKVLVCWWWWKSVVMNLLCDKCQRWVCLCSPLITANSRVHFKNSTQILGLSPRHLFSLDCFTDALPDSQAALLWDHIQNLSDPDPQSAEEDQEFPHVFLLSGHGLERDDREHFFSATNGDVSNSERISWTCWCAVHRPPNDDSENGHHNLLVFEFEREDDQLNPLYPPSSAPPEISSNSSGSATDGGRNTDDSDLTVAPTKSASVTPSLRTVAAKPSLEVIDHKAEAVTAEEIIASTTSHSRPIPALERLRRRTKGLGPVSPTTETPPAFAAEEASARKTRRMKNATGAHGSVGLMDVFAVLSQINEQLGAASDLETFLKILVGVIKVWSFSMFRLLSNFHLKFRI